MHTSRVTKDAPASPWSVATKNLVSGNSWAGSARGDLGAPLRTEGVRFAAAVQRSWSARRPVNAGLLALATLGDDVRRHLLRAWMESGNGTASLFAAEADSLLDFIAEQLPDSSPELALCRVEQLTLRASQHASAFEAPNPAELVPQRVVRRACDAGVVLFPGGSDRILSKLLQLELLPAAWRDATALLVAPGSHPLCRIASHHEQEIWSRLTHATAVHALVRNNGSIIAVGTMLQIGALEYA